MLRDRFDARVYKIGLRLDFTCPNRDGKVAVGGCIYCNNASHTPQDYRPRTSVTTQLEKGALAIHQRHKAEKFIAYFQSYTNTYDSHGEDWKNFTTRRWIFPASSDWRSRRALGSGTDARSAWLIVMLALGAVPVALLGGLRLTKRRGAVSSRPAPS